MNESQSATQESSLAVGGQFVRNSAFNAARLLFVAGAGVIRLQ
jgi:hypothetical protein